MSAREDSDKVIHRKDNNSPVEMALQETGCGKGGGGTSERPNPPPIAESMSSMGCIDGSCCGSGEAGVYLSETVSQEEAGCRGVRPNIPPMAEDASGLNNFAESCCVLDSANKVDCNKVKSSCCQPNHPENKADDPSKPKVRRGCFEEDASNDKKSCCGNDECGTDGDEEDGGCGAAQDSEADSCDDCAGEDVSDVDDSDDDSTLCECCIKVLVGKPNVPSEKPQVLSEKRSYSSDCSPVLRRCCTILEETCLGRACCFVRPKDRSTSKTKALYTRQRAFNQRGQTTKAEVSTRPVVVSRLEVLQMEIRGMNCADCVSKVARAVSQLASVTLSEIDYLTGQAHIHYDAEAINPGGIIRYISRATGFTCKEVEPQAFEEDEGRLTLPFTFRGRVSLSDSVFDGFWTRKYRRHGVVEVMFPVKGPNARRPREVYEQFRQIGGQLCKQGRSYRALDSATYDLVDMLLRTILCTVLSIPVLVLAWAPLSPRPVLHGALSLAFTTGIQAIAFPILSSAVRSIVFLRQADMNVLVSISMMTAFIYSVVGYAYEVAGRPFMRPFFETSALLVTLVFFGRTMTAATRRSTGSATRKLQSLQCTTAVVVSNESEGQETELDTRLLYYGDIIRVGPGAIIATDGIVVAGRSEVDESTVTGESITVSKREGSRVTAGTTNISTNLDIQVTHLLAENSLARITSIVKQAQSSSSQAKTMADKLSAIILPVAAVAAILTFIVWILVSRYKRHNPISAAVVDALTFGISVLIVSCPCALALAIPTVNAVAIRRGIQSGVLFRSGRALEAANSIQTVVFDKTGTLSNGTFAVKNAEILFKDALRLIFALTKDDKHPIAQGIHRHSQPSNHTEPAYPLQDIISLPGQGLKATIAGYTLLGGSPAFTGTASHPACQKLLRSGLSIFTVSLGGCPLAFFGLADQPEPEGVRLISEMSRRGNDVWILSGDTDASVSLFAAAVGVPQDRARGTCTPEGKADVIAELQKMGQNCMFVGDGTNDAPALSQAALSVSVAGATDVALETAGVLLLRSNIYQGVMTAIDLARTCRRHAIAALAWCVIYNILAILLACGALASVGVRIEPRWAGLGEVVSVFPVVVIALALHLQSV